MHEAKQYSAIFIQSLVHHTPGGDHQIGNAKEQSDFVQGMERKSLTSLFDGESNAVRDFLLKAGTRYKAEMNLPRCGNEI